MQNQTQPFAATDFVSQATYDAAQQAAADATASAQAKLAKRASNAANAAKRVSAKPTKPTTAKAAKPATVTAAKPTNAERDAAREQALSDRRLARAIAGEIVSEHYRGTSLPFKAAADTFKPINFENAKPGETGLGTQRQAALLVSMLAYGAGNVQPDGTFKRGGFTVPLRLFRPDAKPGQTVLAQPESGCLGNTLGLTVDYVSGPQSGPGQRDATYRIRREPALKLIAAYFGDKAAKAAGKLLAAA